MSAREYRVTVRRIVREDTVLTVQASSESEAKDKAELEATAIPQEQWDTYDCEYSSEITIERTGESC